MGRTSGTRSPFQNVKNRDSQHHKNADGFGPAEMVNRVQPAKMLFEGKSNVLLINMEAQNLLEELRGTLLTEYLRRTPMQKNTSKQQQKSLEDRL